MQLDRALGFAVILAWNDLARVAAPYLVRVEYRSEHGTKLDSLRVWSDRARGYQDLVCDYWTAASATHPSGASFGTTHDSKVLAQALDAVMNQQGHFTRAADAAPDGLVLVFPPTDDQRAEAASQMSAIGNMTWN
jgi:hypothetical protein